MSVSKTLIILLRSFDLIDMHKVAKKKVAMDALVPIEKLFAVFRDR